MDMKGQPKKIAAFKIEGHLDSRFAKARFENSICSNIFQLYDLILMKPKIERLRPVT